MLLVGAIVTVFLLSETLVSGSGAEAADDDDDDEEEGLTSLLPAFRDRRLATLLLWFLLLEVTGSWVEAVLPLYTNDGGLLTPSGVGLLFTYAAGMVVVAQMIVNKVVARRSAFVLSVMAGGTIVTALAALILAANVGGMVIAVTLLAFADMLVGPLVPTAVNQLAPAGRRATYMAAASVANDVKDSLGPATGTALYAVTARLPWIVAMPLAGVAAIGLGSALRRKGRETAVRSGGDEG